MEETTRESALNRLLEDKKPGKSLDSLFREVINTKAIHAQLGINESTVRVFRKRFNDGTPISVEKKREILELAGYKMVQEERWGS
jgi:DNA-binding GntR family transcriptional regulator